MNPNAKKALADWIDEAAITVHRIEAEAEALLQGSRGQAGYVEKMREKALFLSELADEGRELAAGWPEVIERLELFSKSAATSLSVGSVFFMSALLYPEDHVSGQGNNLDALVKMVKDAS
ncbi:MAG: hypothetical protein KKB70_03700 [Proteobacteria bacterium]|nr:hypothetical protein [Pseudomonadota bacterium]MBU1612334.1 hypothetical protein [Pseudomonadota bacterium]